MSEAYDDGIALCSGRSSSAHPCNAADLAHFVFYAQNDARKSLDFTPIDKTKAPRHRALDLGFDNVEMGT